MKKDEPEKSFGELPTLGHEETPRTEARSAAEGPSWSALGLSEAETLRPAEGIRDDGRTDAARRWKAGEEILGRYVVEKELGQGGMGVVYGCLDKVGGVRVAVKCLPPELSHNSVEMEEVRENFQLVYGLSHPSIAGVRQLERDGRGEYFLVMEEAAGESLRRWLRTKWKAGGVTLAEAVGILRQVAAALDYAHGEKVVHRDVKPGNVMVDARGRVKVLDFGLASQIRTSLSRASHAPRGTSGTGPYMAPEQWRGRRQDGKTDQYALGVMAYEMLAGHLPFENDEVSVLREVVLKEEPEDIPGLPEGAMAAILRAMAKNAADRFPACGAFVDALESAASGCCGAGRGGASRPGEPGKGTTAGRAAGRADGKPAGRTARPEDSPHHHRKGRSIGGWVAVAVVAAGVAAGVWGWREHGEPEEWPGSAGRVENAVEGTARPEGPPHHIAGGTPEAPVADEAAEAAKKAEEERLEAEKQAHAEAQQAAQEAEKKLEEAASEEDDGAKWRAEREAVDMAATSIDILQTHARTTAETLAEYKKNPAGLSNHIAAAEAAAVDLAAILRPATGEEAKTRLEAAQTASGRLTLELGWLAQNKASRDTALHVEREIASTLDAPIKEYEAADSAKGKYTEGTKARKAGNDALAAGTFGEAKAQLEKAKRVLGEALADARADRARRQVASAKQYAADGLWEKCLEMAEAALVSEPGNQEAAKLKADAEAELKPSILLKATLGVRQVAATVTEGMNQSGWKTPVEVPNVEAGRNYSFAAEYEEGGKKYAGQRTVKAKARGVTEAAVALEEVKEEEAGRTKTITLPGGATMEMVWCPAGSFSMGSPPGETNRGDDETRHPVTLTEGFWMAKTEVTQKQWESVMGTTVRQQRDKASSSWPLRGEGDDYPMYYVSWDEAQEFCRKAGHDLQLPTEAQWEYACRAGSPGAYGGTGDLGTMGWYSENSGSQTHPVETKQRNAWGLHDMHGNVWEWCADWYTKDLGTRAVTKPTGPASGSGRVGRGGGWYGGARSCRSASRSFSSPGIRDDGLGFRPVRVRP